MQPKTRKAEEQEATFDELADKLEWQAGYFSFIDQQAGHLAHRQIIEMGEEAVPLILRRIERQGGLWYRALETITGIPVPGRHNHAGSRGRVYRRREGSERCLAAMGPGTGVKLVNGERRDG